METSFQLAVVNFCRLAVQSWSEATILDILLAVKDKLWTKMNENVQSGRFFQNVQNYLFIFLSVIVNIF